MRKEKKKFFLFTEKLYNKIYEKFKNWWSPSLIKKDIKNIQQEREFCYSFVFDFFAKKVGEGVGVRKKRRPSWKKKSFFFFFFYFFGTKKRKKKTREKKVLYTRGEEERKYFNKTRKQQNLCLIVCWSHEGENK